MKNTATTYVAELLSLNVKRGSVDRANGIVRGVRLVGPTSRNGRKYPPAVTAAAVGLYAAPVNVGHHFDPATFTPTPVPPTSRFGRVIEPRAEGGGVTGDLRFNPKHPFADPFCWACENDPAQYSFSPLMQVRWKAGRNGLPELDADGDRVAEAVLEVASVDIVSDGGTTSTVFESATLGVAAVKPDAAAVAAGLSGPAALKGFIIDLVSATTMTPDEVVALLQQLLEVAKMQVPPKTLKDAAAGDIYGEYLRRNYGSADPAVVAAVVEARQRARQRGHDAGPGDDLSAVIAAGWGESGSGSDISRITSGWTG